MSSEQSITFLPAASIFYFRCYTVKLHAFGHVKPIILEYGEEFTDRGVTGKGKDD